MITEDVTIEELMTMIPESVSYLMDKGITCLACGEPIWGTLKEATQERGFSSAEILEFVNDLNKLEKNFKR